MTTVLFDTLALARKLEQAGFPSEQAQATSAALAEVLGAEVATTRDLQTHLDHKFDHLGWELKREIAELHRRIERLERKLSR